MCLVLIISVRQRPASQIAIILRNNVNNSINTRAPATLRATDVIGCGSNRKCYNMHADFTADFDTRSLAPLWHGYSVDQKYVIDKKRYNATIVICWFPKIHRRPGKYQRFQYFS